MGAGVSDCFYYDSKFEIIFFVSFFFFCGGGGGGGGGGWRGMGGGARVSEFFTKNPNLKQEFRGLRCLACLPFFIK